MWSSIEIHPSCARLHKCPRTCTHAQGKRALNKPAQQHSTQGATQGGATQAAELCANVRTEVIAGRTGSPQN
eukprot:2537640-Alexandrium_andersonii.AAC.1